MRWEELVKYPTVEEWLEILNLKPNTRRNYLIGMMKYCDFTGLTPDELLQEADEDVKNGVLPRERRIKKRLIAYRNFLDSQKLADNTKLNDFVGPKSFYRTFDHELPKLPRWNRAQPKVEHLDIPNKEDIRKTLSVCDPRNKAIVLTGCSSGLSADEICRLTVKQFNDGYDPESEITTLFIRRGKSGQDFVTFISPEATRSIKEYLEYRNRPATNNEKRIVTQRDKQRVFGDAGYLFIKKNVSNDYLDSYDEELRKLDTNGLINAYKVLSAKAGLSTDCGTWNLIRSHNMRKFFNTTLKNAGFDSERVEYMMGHALSGVKGAYYRAEADKLKDIYATFVPYLAIQKEIDVSETEEYKQAVQTIDVLSKANAQNVVKLDRMQELEVKIAEMERRDELKKEAIGQIDPEQLSKLVQAEIAKMMNK